MSEHVGTHIDAPLHFSQDGRSVSEIPLAELIVPLCVIDIRARASVDSDTQLTLDDVRAWIALHGDIPPHACVAMLSGWGGFMNGRKFRNAAPDGVLHFPGIHPEVADYLLSETEAVGLAVDTLSLDAGMSKHFPTHRIWLPAGAWGVECVANLDQLPASGSTMFVGAPKHRHGTGGPARVFAFA
jgi:kynurenine formamidase